jgi:hypothetical protein
MSFQQWRILGLFLNFVPQLKMCASFAPASHGGWLPLSFLGQAVLCLYILLVRVSSHRDDERQLAGYRKAELRRRIERIASGEWRPTDPPLRPVARTGIGRWRWLAIGVNVVPLIIVAHVFAFTQLYYTRPIWTVVLLQIIANLVIFGYWLRPDREEERLRRQLARAERQARRGETRNDELPSCPEARRALF